MELSFKTFEMSSRRGFAVLALAGVFVACRTQPAGITPPDAAANVVEPVPSAIASAAKPVTRATRGECAVDVRIRELLGAAPSPITCAALEPDAPASELRAARECVLRAARAQKPFSLLMKHRGEDSRVETGIVGNMMGKAYRLFWIAYDGCPMGCGDADPHSTTQACASLSDLSKDAGAHVWPPIALRCEQPETVDRCP